MAVNAAVGFGVRFALQSVRCIEAKLFTQFEHQAIRYIYVSADLCASAVIEAIGNGKVGIFLAQGAIHWLQKEMPEIEYFEFGRVGIGLRIDQF